MKTSDISVNYIGHYGTDLDVVNAARVSFHKESEWETIDGHDLPEEGGWQQCYYEGGVRDGEAYGIRLSKQDTKLINYLAKHKHFSPFNHAFLTFRVKAPIFVARQLVKHRFMPWNEVSRRYVDEEPEFYFPDKWRKKAENVKQGSSDEAFTGYIWHEFGSHVPVHLQGGTDVGVEEATEYIVQYSLELYKAMIEQGVAPEQARMILPQNTMTEWIWSGTLGAYCDMLRLRLDPHTQYESQIVAKQVYAEVSKLFPVSTRALLEGSIPTT